MNSYGCDGHSGVPPGIDRQLVMCTHTFFDCQWVNDSEVVQTGNNSADYTTSVMGNASVDWIRCVAGCIILLRFELSNVGYKSCVPA